MAAELTPVELVAAQMYRALSLQASCSCTYTRQKNGQPIFEKGERVLERQCLKCEAMAKYEIVTQASERAVEK